MCIFMISCLSENSLNKASEILIFSHFLGTNIATFTDFKPETVNDDSASDTSLLCPKFLSFPQKNFCLR